MSTRFQTSEVFLLHSVVARLNQIAENSILPRFGLTYAEFEFLVAVEGNLDRSQNSLAAMLLLGKSAVSQRVSALSEKGYLEQQGVQDNKRQKLVVLTASGASILAACQTALMDAAEPLLGSLNDLRAPLVAGLQHLADGLLQARGQAMNRDLPQPN